MFGAQYLNNGRRHINERQIGTPMQSSNGAVSNDFERPVQA